MMMMIRCLRSVCQAACCRSLTGFGLQNARLTQADFRERWTVECRASFQNELDWSSHVVLSQGCSQRDLCAELGCSSWRSVGAGLHIPPCRATVGLLGNWLSTVVQRGLFDSGRCRTQKWIWTCVLAPSDQWGSPSSSTAQALLLRAVLGPVWL